MRPWKANEDERSSLCICIFWSSADQTEFPRRARQSETGMLPLFLDSHETNGPPPDPETQTKYLTAPFTSCATARVSQPVIFRGTVLFAVRVSIHAGASQHSRSTSITSQDNSFVEKAPFSVADLEQCRRCRVFEVIRRRTWTNAVYRNSNNCADQADIVLKPANAHQHVTEVHKHLLIPEEHLSLTPHCISSGLWGTC